MTIASVRLPVRMLTLDDVAELADRDPDHRYELQEGNLLVMPPADDEQAEMIMRVGAWLMAGGHAGRVLATPGVRVGSSGRSPDVVVRRMPRTGRTVWIDPADILLIVEIVSPGSVELDRYLKPVEYAQAGVRHFWRVERDGHATVHMFGLGVGSDGTPAYVAREARLLDDLLAGPVPTLD
ncbi:MAG TPA: Uma2 family endonuclease [Micromonosporaceae bacterium]|nr:Uma2 family endonuclease [Micromonosporaceae bacterium]